MDNEKKTIDCRMPANHVHEIDLSGVGNTSVINHTGIAIDFVVRKTGVIEIREVKTNG